MAFSSLHRALDDLAVWAEDRRRRDPQPCRLAPPAPLSCFGPLPPLPEPPPRSGVWSAPSPLALRPDDRMSLLVTPARGERRGTTLLVPPWKIGDPGLVRGYVRLLADAGYDVWLVSLPHHLDRTAPGARSGEGFVSLDMVRLRSVFEQLVLELRVYAALAAEHGPVGLIGLSLGGLAGALAATAPEPLAFAALVAPTHLPTVLGQTRIGRRYRRLALLAGSTWPDDPTLASALAPFDPALRTPTARRLLLAVGRYDRIAPPAGAADLAAALGLTPHVYPRGHMTLLFFCRALRRDLRAFVRAAVTGDVPGLGER